MTKPTGNLLRDLIQQRQATRDLIQQEGRPVALWRASGVVSDGAGGVRATMADQQLPAVTRFLSFVGEPIVGGSSATGSVIHEKFVLVGIFTDDIQEGDYFFFHNKKYYIRYINPNQDFEIRAIGEVADDGRKV